MLAYLVPILGFVIFILLGMLGYGAVLYALLNRIRHSSSTPAPAVGAGEARAAPSFAEPAATVQRRSERAARLRHLAPRPRRPTPAWPRVSLRHCP